MKKSNRKVPSESMNVLYDKINKADYILSKSPNNLESLRTKATSLHKLCHYDSAHMEKAVDCFDQILQINHNDKEAWKSKGELLLRRETINQAINCFDKALEIDPGDPEALWGKAVALQIDGKPYLAEPFFDKALAIDPLDARTWMQKGFALSARGETWEQALECFDKALEINSDDARVWKGKGSILHKKGNLDDAIFCYNKAIELDSRDSELLMLKGYALTGKKEFENAINYFNASLSINNDNIEALRGKGDALYMSGKYDESFSIFNRIIQLKPKDVDALRQKAFCSLQMNKKEEALEDFEKVLEIDPEDIKSKQEKMKLIDQDIYYSKVVSTKQVQSDDESNAIIATGICKKFRIHHEKNDTLLSLLTSGFSKKNVEVINVLQDITFNLKKGEMLGIIGVNGSGKTTLLRILSGILQPDSGKVKVSGTIAPLLQIGVGFNGELTAKENIILAGLLLGFSKKEMNKKVEDIIKFAELEKFADTKIKNFSSGMHARLAFSTAIQVDPDILLVDEILSVGDINFVKKSYKEFLSFREKGKSIIFVSHSLDQIRNLCDRVMILESGTVKMIGNTNQIIEHYIQSNNK